MFYTAFCRSLCCLVAGMALSSFLYAQPLIFQDPVSSRTFNSQKYSGIKGSPFLYEKWMTGSITTNEGIYQNLELKLDAYSNTLFFNKDGELYEFIDPLQSFRIYPDTTDTARYMHFMKGLSGNGLRSDQYVQVLAEGPVSLYRSDMKLLSEMSEINAGLIKTFTNSTRYFILRDNKLQLIKMNKKELMGALKDKEEKVQSYIRENNLSLNRDEDLKKIMAFYNSN